jgi:two-component system chemotaxis response regulator CheB
MVNTQKLKRDVIVIGASAGGVEALIQLFALLPSDLSAVVAAVLHRSPVYNLKLEQVLGRRARLPVIEPAHEEPFKQGTIYLAPRDHHLTLNHQYLKLDRGPREHHTRPAVDPLFRSAAASHGQRVVGVVLTGGGDDGVSGLLGIKNAQGITIAQDPSEARVASMPCNAIIYDHVDLVLPLRDIPAVLATLAKGESVALESSKRVS